MFANRKFRFSHEITVTSLLAAAFCYSMSYWQYDRYQHKLEYFQIVERHQKLGVQPLNPAEVPGQLYARVRAEGNFDYEHEMVILNRSKDNVSGVNVVTPLILDEGRGTILVERGFLPYDLYQQRHYESWRPADKAQVEGIVKPSVTKSFFFSPPARRPGGEEGPGRWLRLEIETMATDLPYPILPLYIEQTNPPAGVLSYDAQAVLPASRHLNYTIQWASFGSFAILFGLFIQFRPKRRTAGPKNQPTGETAFEG